MERQRRRRPVWQQEGDMREVQETFRRVSLVKSSGFSTGSPRVTAPTLSRNRRARAKSQVPSVHVPVTLLQHLHSSRSQPPLVSLTHLQNVLSMCRRIHSQQSITERKKNPHDPGIYPVYVRRPRSSNPNPNPNPSHQRFLSPFTNPQDRPPSFKPLFDLSNGVFPCSGTRNRLSSRTSASSEKVRGEKPDVKWANGVSKLVHHPLVGSPPHSNAASPPRPRCTWDFPHPADDTKSRPRSSPMKNSSWPSSSTYSTDRNVADCFNEDHSLSMAVVAFPNSPDCLSVDGVTPFSDLLDNFCLDRHDLNSDRRTRSENDLCVHSASYLLDRPPSRCMQRPMSSCTLGNTAHLQWSSVFNDLTNSSLANYFFNDWSPESSISQQDGCVLVQRHVNGNSLRNQPSFSTTNIRRGFQDKSRTMQKKVWSRQIKARSCPEQQTGKAKKKIPLSVKYLEGLPACEWVEKLASEVMGRKSTCDGVTSLVPRQRVTFVSPTDDSVDRDAQTIDAQSPAELLDSLSWEQ